MEPELNPGLDMDTLNNQYTKAVSGEMAIIHDEFLKSLLAKEITRRACCVDDSIGIHEDPITGIRLNPGTVQEGCY
jgi:hypothetical protein